MRSLGQNHPLLMEHRICGRVNCIELVAFLGFYCITLLEVHVSISENYTECQVLTLGYLLVFVFPPSGSQWDFLHLILDLSMQLLKPTGKYFTQVSSSNQIDGLIFCVLCRCSRIWTTPHQDNSPPCKYGPDAWFYWMILVWWGVVLVGRSPRDHGPDGQ